MQVSAHSSQIIGTVDNPAQSRQSILNANPAAADTTYWIDSDGPGTIAPIERFFTVVLGVDTNSVALDSDMFDVRVYVGLSLGTSGELTPRSPLLSVPHAAHAVSADTATRAVSADSAKQADVATTGQSLLSPNWGRLIVDRGVDNVTIPVEWTTTYLANNVGRTWIWSAVGPNFRDPTHCGPTIQVYDQDTAWKGQYIVTVENNTRLNVQWSGWYLRVNNSAGAMVDQGNGTVTATLSYESGLWRVQHMSGVARVTPVECH
ncbi:MAG: hypothetical protein ACJATT_003807 [Myxococcota bacterium]